MISKKKTGQGMRFGRMECTSEHFNFVCKITLFNHSSASDIISLHTFVLTIRWSHEIHQIHKLCECSQLQGYNVQEVDKIHYVQINLSQRSFMFKQESC